MGKVVTQLFLASVIAMLLINVFSSIQRTDNYAKEIAYHEDKSLSLNSPQGADEIEKSIINAVNTNIDIDFIYSGMTLPEFILNLRALDYSSDKYYIKFRTAISQSRLLELSVSTEKEKRTAIQHIYDYGIVPLLPTGVDLGNVYIHDVKEIQTTGQNYILFDLKVR